MNCAHHLSLGSLQPLVCIAKWVGCCCTVKGKRESVQFFHTIYLTVLMPVEKMFHFRLQHLMLSFLRVLDKRKKSTKRRKSLLNALFPTQWSPAVLDRFGRISLQIRLNFGASFLTAAIHSVKFDWNLRHYKIWVKFGIFEGFSYLTGLSWTKLD